MTDTPQIDNRRPFKGWWPARLTRRRVLIALGLAATVYVGSYCVLSAMGDYCWSASGERRWPWGLAAVDRAVWHPKYVYCERYRSYNGGYRTRANWLGRFYWPLAMLDHALVHKPRDLFLEERRHQPKSPE